MSPFSIEASAAGAELTIACVGELDASSATVLTDAAGACDAAGAGHVVLDLERLSFIDSTGIATVVRLTQDLATRGIDVVLERPTRTVRRAFEMCGLLHLVERDLASSS